jgi:hypothetical protein
MKYLIVIFFILGCNPYQKYINSEDVNKIIIENKTQNHLISDKISLSDFISIKRIVTEINKMQPVNDSSIQLRNQFGDYDMTVELNDNSVKRYNIIYTVYNGVIITEHNKFGQPFGKLYKNDKLESLILWFFQPK